MFLSQTQEIALYCFPLVFKLNGNIKETYFCQKSDVDELNKLQALNVAPLDNIQCAARELRIDNKG